MRENYLLIIAGAGYILLYTQKTHIGFKDVQHEHFHECDRRIRML